MASPYMVISKWADNKWNLGKMYLPFALGGGYILSHDLVAILSENSPHLMWHLNEDTAIGAWVSAFDHERRSDRRFCLWWKDHNNLSGCQDPILALLLLCHTRNELKHHFHYFHEHPNEKISVLTHDSLKTLKGK